MKKVLVISTSMRKNGNSDTLAKFFANGARESGNDVEEISLANKNIAFCKGCLACQRTHTCVIKDDAVEIAEKIKNADVIVLATPIYYYTMSGQMKTLIDRANPVYGTDYKFREVYLLAACADGDSAAVDGVVSEIDGWLCCFPKAQLKGVITATGVNSVGDIEGNSVLVESYTAGKTV